MGKDGRGWEWREGIVHVGGEDIIEAADGSRLGFKVCDSAVTCLPISLDKVVDIQSVDVMEEGPIFQQAR